MLVVLALGLTGACDRHSKSATPRSGPQRYEGTVTVLSSPSHPPNLCSGVFESLPPQCDGVPIVGWNWDAVRGERRMNGTTWGSWHVVGTYDAKRFTVVGTPTAPRSQSPPSDTDFTPACSKPDVIDPSAGGAEWEAMSQDDGRFEIHDLVASWVSDPAGPWNGPFVGSVVVLPGAKAAAVALVRRHYAGALCVVERDGPTAAKLAAVQNQLLDRNARAVLGTVQSGAPDERRGVVVATFWVVDQRSRDYARKRWGHLVELHALLQPVATAS